MEKSITQIAAEFVQIQAARLSIEEIPTTLEQYYNTLQKLHRIECGDPRDLRWNQETEAVINPIDSIQEHKTVCLECGAEFRQLTSSHLAVHEMSVRAYKQKHGLPIKTSLACLTLQRMRSKVAKRRGLPANLVKYLEQRRAAQHGSRAYEEALDDAASGSGGKRRG